MFPEVSATMVRVAKRTAGWDRDRVRFAVERRLVELRMNDIDLARKANADPKTVRGFLEGVRHPQRKQQGDYEAALGWAPGSLAAIARGGEPTPLGNADTPAVTEDDVLRWLRDHLPDHLGEHIVTQYFILKAAAASGADPPAGVPDPDPLEGRAPPALSHTNV
jgi:hypothetical protein